MVIPCTIKREARESLVNVNGEWRRALVLLALLLDAHAANFAEVVLAHGAYLQPNRVLACDAAHPQHAVLGGCRTCVRRHHGSVPGSWGKAMRGAVRNKES